MQKHKCPRTHKLQEFLPAHTLSICTNDNTKDDNDTKVKWKRKEHHENQQTIKEHTMRSRRWGKTTAYTTKIYR